ncbi:MAG: Do family serine endopeptidase [Paracoccaceae bacterium]
MSDRSHSGFPSNLSKWAGASALSALLLTSAALPAAADAALADLVDEVSPSVVTILAKQKAQPQPANAPNPGATDPRFDEFFKRFGLPEGSFGGSPMPAPGPRSGLGSGFVLEEDGLIVTNHHVVDGADSITVRLSDDREYEAEVVGTDPLTDLAVLKIAADEPLQAVTFGDSEVIRVGEDVVAVGNPFGLHSTVTTGIISAKGRNISAGPYAEFLQTDAAINKGNSGGPLFNMDGEVVGVNSAIYSPTGGSVGLGFAVTSNIVEDIVADLIDDGQVDRGWLGVSIQNVNPEIAAAMGLENAQGALVSDVVKGSPSEGILKTGDIIISFNGAEVEDSSDLPRLVGGTQSGKASEITLIRDGKEQNMTVTLGAHQDSASAGDVVSDKADDPKLGVTVAPLDQAARAEIGVGEDVNGVVIKSLAPNSPAAEAGLRTGDVIVRLGAQEIETPEALISALESEKTDPALLLINRSGSQIFVPVRIA